MKLSTVNFFCIFSLLVLIPFAASASEPAKGDLIDSGLARMEAGEYEQALHYFETVLEENPDDERALAYTSRVLQQMDRRAEAFEYYNRLARREPEEFDYFIPREVYRFSAILAYQVGRYGRSQELFDRALKLAEDETEKEQLRGWRQRASSAQLREQGEKQEEALEKLLRSADQLLTDNKTEQALELLEANRANFDEFERFREKIKQLQKIVDFKNWQEQVEQIDYEVKEKRLDSLIKNGKEFYSQKDFEEQAASYLSRLFFIQAQKNLEAGKYSSARESLFTVFSLVEKPPPEAYQELIRAHYLLGEYERVKERRIELQKNYPEFTLDNRLQWKLWWAKYGSWLGGVTVFIAIFALFFLVLVPLFGRRISNLVGEKVAGWFYGAGKEKIALFIYNLFCSPVYVSEENLKNWVRLLKNRDSQKLFKILQKRAAGGELPPLAGIEYGLLLADNNQTERAINQLKKVAEQWSELKKEQKIRTGIRLSEMLLKNHSPAEALRWLSRTRKETPLNEEINSKIIKLAAQLDRWQEWKKNGKAWLDNVRSGYVQQTQRRGLTTETEKDSLKDPQSISQFLLEIYDKRREVKLEEESTEILNFLYSCLEDLTDYDRQEKLLKELVERDLPGNKRQEYLEELGDLFVDREKTREAIKYYRKLIELEPDDFRVLEKLGRLYVKVDEREHAIDCFEKVFDFEKDNPGAARGLQQIARRYEEDGAYSSAARTYRLILDNSYFEKAEIQFRYGVNLYRVGEAKEALSVFQKIEQGDEVFRARVLVFIARCLNGMDSPGVALSRLKEVDPDNQAFPVDLRLSLHYWYGRSLEGSGNKSEALSHYREIMATDVDYRDVAARIEDLGEQK
ncbi:MAG: tetratricopeptide repeat protein [bacterium]